MRGRRRRSSLFIAKNDLERHASNQRVSHPTPSKNSRSIPTSRHLIPWSAPYIFETACKTAGLPATCMYVAGSSTLSFSSSPPCLVQATAGQDHLGTGDPCRLHATASRACLLRSLIKLLFSSSSSSWASALGGVLICEPLDFRARKLSSACSPNERAPSVATSSLRRTFRSLLVNQRARSARPRGPPPPVLLIHARRRPRI